MVPPSVVVKDGMGGRRLARSGYEVKNDHFVVLGEAHLRRILGAYAAYYNVSRTHRSLDKDAPFSRPVQRAGSIHSYAILGGLHPHYVRVSVFGTHNGGLEMIDVGPVQSITTKSGDYGWGFIVKDSTRLRWITLTYRTEAEANAAREQIKDATAGVIDASIA